METDPFTLGRGCHRSLFSRLFCLGPAGRSSGGGGGGLFGGFGRRSSAPASRPAAPKRAAPPAPTRTAPPPAQQGGGGGMLSGIGSTIAQGMAFGTGSAVAHRAVDAVAGPRQVEHVNSGGEAPTSEGQQQQQPAAAAQTQQPMEATNDCSHFQADLSRCLETNTNDIAACQGYFDMFKSCQQQQSEFR